MLDPTDIVVVGGYGTVGRWLAADLASDYPGRIIVAGRSLARAEQLAGELGHGVRGRRIDVDDSVSITVALDGVGVIASCIDQREPHLLHAAIARGLAYTDIAPHLMTRRPTSPMKSEAARTGARILLGAGLAPGISSMLARLGTVRTGAAESIASTVLLSVGDVYGPASRRYLMEELTFQYSVLLEGQLTPIRPFLGAIRVRFPPPLGWRTAYFFPFSDQVFFPDTLGARTSVARLALNPPWLGGLLSALVRIRGLSSLRRHTGTREHVDRLNAWLQRRYAGLDWCGLVVEVRGSRGLVRVGLVGRGQARATGVGAALLVRSLVEGEVADPGIWLAEQVVPLDPFLMRVRARGLVPVVEEPLGSESGRAHPGCGRLNR